MTNSAPGPSPESSEVWSELPALLVAARSDASARDRVVTLLYPELKRIAEIQMRRERHDHTLQATGLVSEFFVHLARSTTLSATSRAQFLVIAAVVMRRVLVDYARTRKRDKRGGRFVRVELEHAEPPESPRFVDLLEIDELLSRLAESDPRMAQIVELRFFGGLTVSETGEALGINERTVKRDWQVARAWLYSQLRRDDSHDAVGLGED
jgi:RNA polymerase sigma factor (TIGR02999 family)